MASLTRWTWVWASSRSWWWTGKSGMLQSMGSQSQTRLSNWTELNNCWLQYLSNEYILRCNSSLNDWSLFSWNTLNQKILFLFEKESIRFFLYAMLVEEERRCFYVPVRTFPQLPPSPSYLNYIMIQVEKADKTKLGNQFWLLPLKCLLVTRRINALTMQMFLIYCSAFRYPDTGDSYQHHRRYRPSLQRQQSNDSHQLTNARGKLNNKKMMLYTILITRRGFPGSAAVKNLPASAGDARDTGSIPWIRKIAWGRTWLPAPISLPGISHGQRSLEGRKELDTTYRLSTHHTRPRTRRKSPY